MVVFETTGEKPPTRNGWRLFSCYGNQFLQIVIRGRKHELNIYIDESGSINNHEPWNKYFVIALVHVSNINGLKRSYKRFVSSNIERLKELDQDRIDERTGAIRKQGGKMFLNGKFQELKGSMFDSSMKKTFIEFFSKKDDFEVFCIKVNNHSLTNSFCENTARAFNYLIRKAMEYFISKNYLPDEDCFLQLDERNERPETRYFLENYLNTELALGHSISGTFKVKYFDSCDNKLIQIADVYSNIYYSYLYSGNYRDELFGSKKVKRVFEFPLN